MLRPQDQKRIGLDESNARFNDHASDEQGPPSPLGRIFCGNHLTSSALLLVKREGKTVDYSLLVDIIERRKAFEVDIRCWCN